MKLAENLTLAVNDNCVFDVARLIGQTLANRYGAGTGLIWFDHVECTGSETFIGDCPHKSSHDCTHYEDVSIRCTNISVSPPSRRGTTKLS